MSRVIVTGGSKSDIAAIGVLALNIRDTNVNIFDKLIVFHDGIGIKNQKIINSIFPTEFHKYVFPFKLKNDEVINHFTDMVYCKYECFRLLEEFDEVVWTDYDVLIKHSLEEFCSFQGHGMNVLDGGNIVRDMFTKCIENTEILEYDLEADGIIAPLMAFNRTIVNGPEIAEWCYAKTQKWDRDLAFPEQGIFSLAVQKFGIKFSQFPFKQYACFPTDATGGEYILHAYGPKKFWNGLNNTEWNVLYSKWIGLGGSRNREFSKKLKAKIRFLISRIRGIRGKERYY